MVGQDNCGDNLAAAVTSAFKLSFEIAMTGQTVFVNQS
jgi:hypothetical protein